MAVTDESEVEIEPEGKPTSVESAIEAMNALHIDIGQRAAQLALTVLEQANPGDIPFPAAVSLLKFGIDLERKALLGVEDDGGGVDPFEQLARSLTPGSKPTNEPPKEG